MSAENMKRNADREVLGRVDKFGRALGLEMMSRIMRKTPVDTGRARANWNASINRADGSTTNLTEQRLAMAKGEAVIRRFNLGEGETLYVTNGLPYIERLEDGYSRQAPAGMVKLTVHEIRPLADRIAARVRFTNG